MCELIVSSFVPCRHEGEVSGDECSKCGGTGIHVNIDGIDLEKPTWRNRPELIVALIDIHWLLNKAEISAVRYRIQRAFRELKINEKAV